MLAHPGLLTRFRRRSRRASAIFARSGRRVNVECVDPHLPSVLVRTLPASDVDLSWMRSRKRVLRRVCRGRRTTKAVG